MDNLFVVVEEYDHYKFHESKVMYGQCYYTVADEHWVTRVTNMFFTQEETLMELQQLASKLPWTNALEVWKLNSTLKKKKGCRKGGNGSKVKASSEVIDTNVADTEPRELPPASSAAEDLTNTEVTPGTEANAQDTEQSAPVAKVTKFRVTCNRAGDKHSFSSNEAARDFGGAVQEFFQWKADMTKFDIEVSVLVRTGLT